MSIDAARWTPTRREYTFRALFIPADADERTGEWLPVPDRLLEFAAVALDIEEQP
jgi:hypothetical protein